MGFEGISIALSGMYANQRAIDVAAHNISNADNPDYVRQRALQFENSYNTIGYNSNGEMLVGTGVTPQAVAQLRNEFLDNKYRTEVVSYGYFSGLKGSYDTLQTTFDEINDGSDSGLKSIMNSFWDKVNSVKNDPQSLTNRSLLKDGAIALCTKVNSIGNTLISFRQDEDNQIVSKVKDINDMAKQIANLNQQITAAESGGENANDYRDLRNKYLDNLSADLGIQITKNSQGMVNVLVNGNNLVSGNSYNQINVTPQLNSDGQILHNLTWSNTGKDINLEDQSGSMKALLDTRDKIIPGYKNELDTLVKKMASSINSVHEKGYGLDGSTNNLFFVGADGTTDNNLSSENIQFNSALNDTNKIAASKSPSNLGDGSNIGDILNQRSINTFIFKDITGAAVTASTIDLSSSKTFDVIFNNKKVSVDISSAVTASGLNIASISVPSDLTALSSAITTAMNQAITGQPYNATTNPNVVTLGFDSSNNVFAMKLSDELTNVMAVDDNSGCLGKLSFSPNTTFDDFYGRMITGLGEGGQQAGTIADGQNGVINQIDNSRKALSSVSNDEELAQTLVFQHAYDASARVVNAIDKMMDDIIQMVK